MIEIRDFEKDYILFHCGVSARRLGDDQEYKGTQDLLWEQFARTRPPVVRVLQYIRHLNDLHHKKV